MFIQFFFFSILVKFIPHQGDECDHKEMLKGEAGRFKNLRLNTWFRH